MGGREPVLPQALEPSWGSVGADCWERPGQFGPPLIRERLRTKQTGTNLYEPEALLRQVLSRVYQAQQGALHRFPNPGVIESALNLARRQSPPVP